MSERRGELYRDPHRGKIAGVCSGLADYFGWETWLVRILVVSGVLLGMQWFVVIYVAAWFILDKKLATVKKNKHFSSEVNCVNEKENDAVNESIKVKARIWQSGEPPRQAFHDIKNKYGVLEGQLRLIEKYVTSPEFTVSREINRL
jgi:phage shock protein C|tara:strand:+ start:1100 stop:1537 length:438 start_codon:yes stop_codon:yes gene_type:complete